MDIHERLKALSQFLSEYAVCLLASGVHTSRIVRNTSRIADSFGFNVQMTIFQKTIIMTLRTVDNSHVYSTVSSIHPMPISFEVNSDLSALSWAAYDEHLSLEQLWERYHTILAKPKLNQYLVLALVSVANASFARLFGADWVSCLIVLLATMVGFFLRVKLLKWHVNHFFVWFLSALAASLCTSSAILFQLGTTPDVALGTSVLYLVPGVPLINGIIDIIEGHVLSGVSRLINALLLIVCLSAGLLCTIMIVGGNLL